MCAIRECVYANQAISCALTGYRMVGLVSQSSVLGRHIPGGPVH